uniref:Uncharacterized protein n=1 Tax=Panstrongylus lignarius TaxID=156445 RepID=A0A224Y0L2_9HEMI
MKFKIYSCIILYLSIYILLVEGFGGLARAGSLSGVKSNKSGSKKSADGRLAVEQTNTGGVIKSSKSANRGYFSAWGIISLIMLVIVGTVLVYYLSIFYPLVCAERGKYDVMEMTTV